MRVQQDVVPPGQALEIWTVLRLLWARRWRVMLTTIVVTAMSVVVAQSMTPVYRATTIVAPVRIGQNSLDSGLGQLGGLAALAGIGIDSGAAVTEESLAVVKSRRFTEDFIREEGLLQELFSDQRRGLIAKILDLDQNPTLAGAYKYFDETVRTIVQDRRTGLIQIHIVWDDPEIAERWANRLVAQLNAEMRRREISATAAAMAYLEKELETTSVIDTRQAITRLMEGQISQAMIANVTEEYSFRVIDPAMAPDVDDPISPNKVLLVALGLVLGGMLGCMLALFDPRKVRINQADESDSRSANVGMQDDSDDVIS
jgi:uncharacterized protein involved in exopolysaccharide biosynthesis